MSSENVLKTGFSIALAGLFMVCLYQIVKDHKEPPTMVQSAAIQSPCRHPSSEGGLQFGFGRLLNGTWGVGYHQ